MNKRSAVARKTLIRAAERLFGKYGVDVVSMRQIVSEAGFSNHYGVQYHFGGKSTLVDAIFADRLLEMENHRSRLLRQAAQRGDADTPEALAEILYRPLTELRDESGQRTYAAFLLALQNSEDRHWSHHVLNGSVPVAKRVKDLFIAAAAHVPGPLLQERRQAAGNLVLMGIVQRDRQGRNLSIDALAMDEAIKTAAAIMSAPVIQSAAGLPTRAAGRAETNH